MASRIVLIRQESSVQFRPELPRACGGKVYAAEQSELDRIQNSRKQMAGQRAAEQRASDLHNFQTTGRRPNDVDWPG